MNLDRIKALQETAAAAVADLGAALSARDSDDGLTDVGKLVRSLVIDCDRVTYQRDQAETEARALRKRVEVLEQQARHLHHVGELAAAELRSIEKYCSSADRGEWFTPGGDFDLGALDAKLDALRPRDEPVLAGDDGYDETKPSELRALIDDTEALLAKRAAVDVSHAGMPSPTLTRCASCTAARGHFAGCEGGAQ